MAITLTPTWAAHAACVGADPELFDPPTREEAKSVGQVLNRLPRYQEAATYCARCPVASQCRSWVTSWTDVAPQGWWAGQPIGADEGIKLKRRALKSITAKPTPDAAPAAA